MVISIYCPKCGLKVGTHDGKSKINLTRQCKNCKIRVVFNRTTGEARVRPLTKRTTSSGVTFGV